VGPVGDLAVHQKRNLDGPRHHKGEKMKFTCPHCHHEYNSNKAHPGKKAKCKECGLEFVIESETPSRSIVPIIAAIIITAGLTIPFSFMAGTLHYRNQLKAFKSENANLKSHNQGLISSSKKLQTASVEFMEGTRKELNKLYSENKTLKSNLGFYKTSYGNLTKQIQDIEQNSLTITNGSEETNRACGDFQFTNLIIKGGSETWIKGVIENQSFKDYDSVSFDISFFDKEGIVLGVGQTTISSFKLGQKRVFQDHYYDIYRPHIAGYKIDISSKY